MRAAYESRAAVVARIDGQAGLRCHMPQGGMFIMLDVRACGISATEFAERLLESEGVSVLPIEAFGPSGAGHVRIALAADEETPGRGLPRASRASPRACDGTRGTRGGLALMTVALGASRVVAGGVQTTRSEADRARPRTCRLVAASRIFLLCWLPRVILRQGIQREG